MLSHPDLTFAEPGTPSIPLALLTAEAFDGWKLAQDAGARSWAETGGFVAGPGQVLLFPGENGGAKAALGGVGTAQDRARGRFALAAVAQNLPAGTYHIESGLPQAIEDIEAELLGWLLSNYRFEKYKKTGKAAVRLIAPEGVDVARIEAIAAGEALTRDLINTPANDMTPDGLQSAAAALAAEFDAGCDVISGTELLAQNFPMIHTVGRASDCPPRLIDMHWGTEGPKLTLVGKGVCFDTGGLNLKPGASMGLMKKDMGGAATVLGLARMIMALKLPLQLRVLIPAVENSVSAGAFRPGDILTSRKGLTVEINNTDAEGRLVLADALALAVEEPTDLVISMATLTGAARVAVGPDLSPFFSDDATAGALEPAGRRAHDPLWRMPFWDPYETMIEPGIADLDNAPKGGFAGAITAALFLRRFVDSETRYAHFDIYGWQPDAKPARPKGGVGMGARAILAALPELLALEG
ncbi:leucyl aminopeptidase family protein [Marinovum sp. 2_MG-2023]|uniref:leucyl aminopeptidase family protein n=1 Tax=unclassified Marinovum TaxID=2647166 RepID=UPI0026E46864|nr:MULTISPECIES: leucyl aminopeptidase family protein [unclassified Marinovum]MDO6730195.1 leucyl aminopeptidase family protein [Marinovum sp. 2_MG-2023]MDO6778933.1 leucyl aminopeptidase family protein [Marinovum sp. 1_MG-2023]